MTDFKIENTLNNGLLKKFEVIVPHVYVEKKIEDWFLKHASSIKLDGFRAGKVPIALLRKNFEKKAYDDSLETITHEVVRFIEKEYDASNYTKAPELSNFKFSEDKSISFDIAIILNPEINIDAALSHIIVPKIIIDVQDKEIETHIHNRFFNTPLFIYKPEDSCVDYEDQVCLKVDVSNEKGRVIPKHCGVGVILVRNSEGALNYNKKLPQELIALLHGKQKGSVVQVKLLINDELSTVYENLGRTLSFSAKIVFISSPVQFTEVNDTFLTYIDSSREKFYEDMKQEIQQQYDLPINLYYKRKILDALDDYFNIELPDALVQKEFNVLKMRFDHEQKNSTDTEEDSDETLTEEQIVEQVTILSKRRVKLSFVLEKMGEHFNIVIYEKEFKDFAKENQNFINTMLNANIAPVEIRNHLAMELRENKIVSHLLGKVQRSEERVSLTDLVLKFEGVIPGFEQSSPKNTPLVLEDTTDHSTVDLESQVESESKVEDVTLPNSI